MKCTILFLEFKSLNSPMNVSNKLIDPFNWNILLKRHQDVLLF
jgi:hypothetical protein